MCLVCVLFIHSSVGEHIGCFYVLVIVNNAAMIIGVKASVWFLLSVLWGIYLGMELLDHIILW